jgi:hypothetical protein
MTQEFFSSLRSSASDWIKPRVFLVLQFASGRSGNFLASIINQSHDASKILTVGFYKANQKYCKMWTSG